MTRPAVTVTARGARLVQAGHPFLSPADVQAAPAGPGDVVRVVDGRGAFLATGLWAPQSRIPLRPLSQKDRDLDEALLRERLGAALSRRRALLPPEWDAYRVVHAEADRLPGLFVDRYGPAAVLQTACAAMDARKDLIARLLLDLLGVSLVLCRDDGSARDLEGLPRERRVLHGGPDTLVRFHDAGVLHEADLLTDGKTGAFLDQQENHALTAALALKLCPGGAALDAFTYHGGFALALARAGLSVQAGDENPTAVARARRNAELNGLALEVRVANAFDRLRELCAAGARFSVVVIDPPALAKRRGADPGAAMKSATRAYKELNLRALQLLAPGGLLISCSCSARLSPTDFGEVLKDAARDAGRPLRLLSRRGAGADHPVLLGVPETEYLKCWSLQALT